MTFTFIGKEVHTQEAVIKIREMQKE